MIPEIKPPEMKKDRGLFLLLLIFTIVFGVVTNQTSAVPPPGEKPPPYGEPPPYGRTRPPIIETLPPNKGGICEPYIEIKMKKGNVEKKGQDFNFNTEDDTEVRISKGDNLEFAVRLANKGENLVAKCWYNEFTCQTEDYTETYPCCLEEDLQTGLCLQWSICTRNCTRCKAGTGSWTYNNIEEFINEPKCEIEPKESNIGIKLSDNNKVFKKDKDNNLFSVRSYEKFNKTFSIPAPKVFSNEFSNIYKNFAERFGQYYLDAQKTSGSIYNVPDPEIRAMNKKEISCGNLIYAKQYQGCERYFFDLTTKTWVGFIDVNVGIGSKLIFVGERKFKVTPTSSQARFYVQPANVSPFLNIGKPNIQHPTNIKTPKRDYIVGYSFPINFGVEINGPGIFGEDLGWFWSNFVNACFKITNSSNSRTINYTPSKAGFHKFIVEHNADDEKNSLLTYIEGIKEAIGNFESINRSIQVYRYLCYQGFCYECPEEPGKKGGVLDVKSAGCQVVEPAKCKAYINSDCKTKGKE